MMVYFFVFKLRCKGYIDLTIPFYLLSIVVLMFLFAVLVYLLHEENWRVNGQICEPFGPVRMDECEEGDTAHGYRDLAWTTASIGFAAALAIACMAPRLPRGDMILRNSSRAFGLNPLPFICPCMGLILGVSFYAYFITFLIFTVSTGDPTSKISDIYPGGSVRSWDFHAAERVLVFFDIGMILWWFSFIVHAVEFVTAGTTAWWFFEPKSKDMVAHIRRSVHALFRYHCGSVLLAAVIVPAGRFLRNLFGALKFGIRYCFHGCLGCSMIVFKPCLFTYEHWFKYMTSDGMAFQTVMGGQYIQSAKHAYHLVKRQNKNGKSQDLLNSGNMVIWLYQLTIMMSGVVFVAWWLQYDIETYKSLRSFSVTSITAMALYELFITWFMAQLYAGFVRGVMHASVVCYLVNLEANNGGLSHGTPFVQSMHGLISKDGHFETDAEVSKARDYTSKVAPESAPVASHLDKPVSNPKPSDLLSSERHQPEAAPFKETPKEERAPTPPAEERHEIHQGVEEETELVSGKEKVGPSAHS